MSEPTFADLGEDRLVGRILARIPVADHVLIGPGDDAAVSISPGRLVSTADMLVEGEDFLQGWLDPFRLGVKAAAQNLADVRAMGAQPTGLLLSLAAPGHTPASFVDGLLDGMIGEAARAGASVLGGDLSDAPQIVISVTALGNLHPGHVPFTRDAAQAGFDVLLGGQTGWAAAGLDLLLAAGGALPEEPAVSTGDSRSSRGSISASSGDRGASSTEVTGAVTDLSALLSRAIEAQRAPRPDYACIDTLRSAAEAGSSAVDSSSVGDTAVGDTAVGSDDASTHVYSPGVALIDLSDGLTSDAGRMARSSTVVIDLDSTAVDSLADDLVPIAAHVLRLKDAQPLERTATDTGGPKDRTDSAQRARALARRWVLTGGEDHGFLAAAPQGLDPLGWTRIGRVRPVATDAGTAGAPNVLLDGLPVDDAGFAAVDPDGGFRHFSGAGE